MHFANNITADNTDQLCKVKLIINLWNEKFKEIYTLKENISIDESLIKFKERLSYMQFNLLKRVRFDIKIYKLCESNTGFCYHFKIYTRQNKMKETDSASENVMELSILNKGHILFLNNWYSSSNLFSTLI